MEEKYCTNCGAEFMIMKDFNICGYCKTNTLVKKQVAKKTSPKKTASKKPTLAEAEKASQKNRSFSKKKWWEFWK
jgi:hypothetical protein